jgi:hypothetical protein
LAKSAFEEVNPGASIGPSTGADTSSPFGATATAALAGVAPAATAAAEVTEAS